MTVSDNKTEAERIAAVGDCGTWNILEDRYYSMFDLILTAIDAAEQRGRNKALDEACKVVFGMCESDNVAQRTVDAIRKLKGDKK